MANICKNTITVVGLQESPETFVKALSKTMFEIDLDDMDPTKWGYDATVNGRTWYSLLADEYLREGCCAARYCVLYPHKPNDRLGVVAPRYYVETQRQAPVNELIKASLAFPSLTFHLDWWVLQDGPTGEFVIHNGKIIESIKRQGSWYLFDWDVLYPCLSLLPAHMPYTLAQHGALRIDDAANIVQGLRRILDNKRFVESPYQVHRDLAKLEQTRNVLDNLLTQIQDAAKQLTFDGVFLKGFRDETSDTLEEDVLANTSGN